MSKAYAKGLTLAELLLAAAILVFALCGILFLFVNCAFLNEANRNLTTAMSHAQYVMEEIKNSDFSAVQAEIGAGNWDLNAAQITARNLSLLPNEQITTAVFPAGAPAGSDPLGVSVKVDWDDAGRRPRFTVLNTQITDY